MYTYAEVYKSVEIWLDKQEPKCYSREIMQSDILGSQFWMNIHFYSAANTATLAVLTIHWTHLISIRYVCSRHTHTHTYYFIGHFLLSFYPNDTTSVIVFLYAFMSVVYKFLVSVMKSTAFAALAGASSLPLERDIYRCKFFLVSSDFMWDLHPLLGDCMSGITRRFVYNIVGRFSGRIYRDRCYLVQNKLVRGKRYTAW